MEKLIKEALDTLYDVIDEEYASRLCGPSGCVGPTEEQDEEHQNSVDLAIDEIDLFVRKRLEKLDQETASLRQKWQAWRKKEDPDGTDIETE